MEYFLTIIGLFATSFVIGLSGAVMPGPMLTVTINQTRKTGLKTGPIIILGHAFMECIMLTLLLLGLAPILTNDKVFSGIGLIGAAVLIYLGIGMLKSMSTIEFESSRSDAKSTNLILSGIITSVSNPFWFVWWSTIGLGYITYSLKYGYSGLLAFFSGHLFADFLWYFLISFVFTKGSHFITPKIYKGIIGGCGVMLLLFAIIFGYQGLLKIS